MSNPPRLRDFLGFLRPRLCLSRQPTGRQRPAERERQRELGRAVPSRRRERPLGAALKPAAVKAGIIPEPKKDQRGRLRYATTRKEGIHQLRHYYASVMLAGGVSIREVADYLGHADPAFTLRVYTRLLPSSHDRARQVINDHFTRMHADADSRTSGEINSDGTGTA